MPDRYGLYAYWGAREESLSGAANQVLALLGGLSALDELFSEWSYTTWPAGKATANPLPLEHDAIEQLLAEGVLLDDAGNLMPNSGYQLAMWCDNEDRSAGLKLLIGEPSVVAAPNSLRLTFDQPEGDPSEQVRTMTAFLELVATVFDPDCASVTWDELWDEMFKTPGRLSSIPGWLTWLSPRRPPPAAIHGAEARALSGGTLITLADHPDDVDFQTAELVARQLDVTGATASYTGV